MSGSSSVIPRKLPLSPHGPIRAPGGAGSGPGCGQYCSIHALSWKTRQKQRLLMNSAPAAVVKAPSAVAKPGSLRRTMHSRTRVLHDGEGRWALLWRE